MNYPAIRPTTVYIPSSHHRFALSTALDGALARELLTPDERRLSECLPASDRRGYRAGRLAARRALWGMERDPRGPTPAREPAVAVAHAGGRAVAAASPGPAQLGIALARRRGTIASDTRLYSAPAEAGLSLDDPAVLLALRRASWQALGLRGEARLGAIELCFSQTGCIFAVQLARATLRAAAAVALPWGGWVAAVVSLEPVS